MSKAQSYGALSKRDYDNILDTAYQNARKGGAPADIQKSLISTLQLIIKKNTNITQAIEKAEKHHSDLMNQDNTGGYANRSPQQTSAPKQSPTTGKDPNATASSMSGGVTNRQAQQARDEQDAFAREQGVANPYRNQGR